jgi:hypothetical protein
MTATHLRRTIATTTLVLAGMLPVVAAGPAIASGGGDDVVRRGPCSGSTDWKIKAKPDDGRIEVEAEIDSNVTGQAWRWVLRHNGSVSSRGTARTHAPSGSFSVERRTVNGQGADSFRFRASNPRSGEVCVARVRL